jgi:flagellar assembly protein FliH
MFRPTGPGGEGAFARDGKFWPVAAVVADPEPAQAEEPVDPLELARAEGYAAGRAQALADAAAQAEAAEAARSALTLSIARLDEAETARLAYMLRQTVEALCHEVLAEAAIDPSALSNRAQAAAAMLARAEDQRTFRFHPDDLALIGHRIPAEWQVLPDTSLERGSIRIETPAGGVEDGPGRWRDALAEALRSC